MNEMEEKKMAYCEECDEEVEYIVSEKRIKTQVKGDVFEVAIKIAHCKKCGKQVYPFSIAKENDLKIYDEYRKRHNLLTSSEIIAIRKKRGLTQVQLAKLIECGEKNIARYENGTIQDKVFDKFLRLIDDDYYYYHYCVFDNDRLAMSIDRMKLVRFVNSLQNRDVDNYKILVM